LRHRGETHIPLEKRAWKCDIGMEAQKDSRMTKRTEKDNSETGRLDLRRRSDFGKDTPQGARPYLKWQIDGKLPHKEVFGQQKADEGSPKKKAYLKGQEFSHLFTNQKRDS